MRILSPAAATASPLEALNIFHIDPYPFDLIITDQTIPHLTGRDLARQALAVRADIPVILGSGYGAAITDESIKEAGSRAIAMKPLEKKLLAGQVRSALEQPQ